MQDHSTIKLENSDGVTILYLDNPPVNAINLDVLDDLEDFVTNLEGLQDSHAVVITGTGRCLSAGLDLKSVPHYSPSRQRQLIEGINRVVTRFYTLPIPTVAAVNGHAIAGGFIIVLTCDYRIGTTLSCEIGLTESKVGISFPVATLEVVKAELSPEVVRRTILPGRTVGPQEALASGVLDELQAPDALLDRAKEVALDFARLPREGYSRIKAQLRAETVNRIERTIQEGDPLLRSWMTEESRTASTERLSEK